ncbi:MAG TPA: BlaB/IND/MUS family subclass B1 metallo-beta-lactamase [Saprospiraceae bacterium]|nr:BlaB/IND/MUS family subclass B1 metallo-beta-lactamase [Saprospiraceae bacterium]
MKSILFSLSLFFAAAALYAQPPEKPLQISHLTGDFYVYTTWGAYKSDFVPANGLYVVSKQGVVLIDTPWDTTQFQPLLDSIWNRHQQKVSVCIATHSHEDRTGGLEFYRQHGVRTFTTVQTDLISRKEHHKRAEFLLQNDTIFTVGGITFQTYYAGPGHTVDNIVVWFPGEKVLHGGCLVKSTEASDLGYIGEADLTAWPGTIRSIQKKYGKIRFVIPGHGDWHSKKALRHTLKLLKTHHK